MADLVSASAQAIADALAPSPQAPAARWRWGTVVSVNADGTMNVSIGGATVASIRCAQHVMGAQVGDRVRVLYLGTEAMVDAIRATDSEPHIDKDAWLDALGLEVEKVYEDASWTVIRQGHAVMVQMHGATATPGSNTALLNVLSDYKPSYNVSTLVTDASGNTRIARLWVAASDGKVYLAVAGYTSSSSWYGTLVYIYE